MSTAEQQTYLAIPYEERDDAKRVAGKLSSGENALGFDNEAKLWFAKPGADLSKLSKWIPDNTLETGNVISAQNEFAQTLETAGFILDDLPTMDGTRQRAMVEGDKGSQKSGVYVGHSDGTPAGWYQNHRSTTDAVKWVSTGQHVENANDVNLRAAAAQRRQERAVAQNRTYVHHARRVNLAIQLMKGADERNAYLARKQVIATDGLHEDKKGRLIVPLYDENDQIHSFQRISGNGFKSLKKGALKSGNFFRVGEPTKDGEPILYAEGYATAASVHEATNKTVYMTIDAGNMPTVATKLAAKYPNSSHVFLADNDQTKDVNKGLVKAQEGADLTGGTVLVAQLTDAELAAGNSDFNDVHVLHGLDALRAQLKEITNMTPATTEKLDNDINAALAIAAQNEEENDSFLIDPTFEQAHLTGIEMDTGQGETARQDNDAQEQPVDNEADTGQANVAGRDNGAQEQPVDDEANTGQANAAGQDNEAQVQPVDDEAKESNSVDKGKDSPIVEARLAAIPEQVAKKYIEVDGKFYFDRSPDTLAFIDKGTKIQTKLSSAAVASSMIDIAEARGWTQVHVRGEREFKRLAWLEAASRGITVLGYTPRETDLAMLKKVTNEKTVNEVDSEPFKKSALNAAQTANAQQQEAVNPMAGTLVDYGVAPYKNDKKSSPSYFVSLENEDGQVRTTWGKDLQRAIEGSEVQPGQHIELEHLGRKEVTVNAPVRNESGNIVGHKEIQTHRNEWAINTEVLRDKDTPLTQVTQPSNSAVQTGNVHQKKAVNPMAGTLVDSGVAPYKNEKENNPSYFVSLENEDGQVRTTWGKDLQRAIEGSEVQPGQHIELEHLGRKEVTVNAPVRNESGKVIGHEEIQTHRNEWAVHANALRDKDTPLTQVAQEHPELVNEVTAIKIAEKFSARLPANHRGEFVDRVREHAAAAVSQGKHTPTIKMRERTVQKENDAELER